MKVSIIVPIYNVELYIRECLESIKNQTYQDIEVILVNDGTKDNSFKIAKETAINDARFKFFEKENGGLSDARNYGIQFVTGELLTFIDSDDFVEQDYILKMVQAFVNKGATMVVAGFKYEQNGSFKDSTKKQSKQLEKTTAISYLYQNQYSIPFSTAWGKLCPTKWYTESFFPKGKIHEDEFTTYKLYLKAKSIYYVDEPLYVYRIRENSIMSSRRTYKNTSILDALKERIAVLQQNQLPTKETCIGFYRYLYLFKYKLEGEDLKQYLARFKDEKSFIKQNLKSYKLTLKERIKLFVFKFLGKIYFK